MEQHSINITSHDQLKRKTLTLSKVGYRVEQLELQYIAGKRIKLLWTIVNFLKSHTHTHTHTHIHPNTQQSHSEVFIQEK